MNYEYKELREEFYDKVVEMKTPPEMFRWITQVFAKKVERKERKKLLKLIKEARDIFKGEDHIFVLDVLEQGLKNEK